MIIFTHPCQRQPKGAGYRLTCAVGGMLAVSASICEPATSPRANTRSCLSTRRFPSVSSAPFGFVSKGSFSFCAAWLAGELPAVHNTMSAGMVLLASPGNLTCTCCFAGGGDEYDVLASAVDG